MAYRPYPDVDRALNQLARHVHPAPSTASGVHALAETLRAFSITAEQAMAYAGRNLRNLRLAAPSDL